MKFPSFAFLNFLPRLFFVFSPWDDDEEAVVENHFFPLALRDERDKKPEKEEKRAKETNPGKKKIVLVHISTSAFGVCCFVFQPIFVAQQN